jgi:hypothetical protein
MRIIARRGNPRKRIWDIAPVSEKIVGIPQAINNPFHIPYLNILKAKRIRPVQRVI